jgi:hypothetical protein
MPTCIPQIEIKESRARWSGLKALYIRAIATYCKEFVGTPPAKSSFSTDQNKQEI